MRVDDLQGRPVWSLPARASDAQRKAWRRAMIDWVDAYLDRIACREMSEASAADFDEVEIALMEAERGNYARLRKLYPRLAAHLNPPARGRGRPKRQRGDALTTIEAAARDVPKVRRLFLEPTAAGGARPAAGPSRRSWRTSLIATCRTARRS